MASKQPNRAGSIYRRQDGRYVASMFVPRVGGGTRRVSAYARTSTEAREKLGVLAEAARKNLPTADRSLTVAHYLDYWMTTVIPSKTRARTQQLYEFTVRRRLVPLLGPKKLAELSLPDVQAAVNYLLTTGTSIRSVQLFRTVLSSALTRAMKEELVHRNVARLIELPRYERKDITPWTADEATRFLESIKGHQWELGFQLLILYGMRRGEVLGLRWSDIDWQTDTFKVRQQLQRINGAVVAGPVKTSAGRRILPLLPTIRAALEALATQSGIDPTSVDQTDERLILLSATGQPMEPGNFTRTFLLRSEQAGLPRITVHHTRHTAATLLKSLGVSPRDAQLILGHANVTTTQQLYQHGDVESQRTALASVADRLVGPTTVPDGAAEGFDSSALLSTLLSTAENPVGASVEIANENRRLPEVATADFVGGSGGTRTHDILLKSPAGALFAELPTSVIQALHTRSKRQLLGRVAVKTAVKPVSSASAAFDRAVLLRDACNLALAAQLRRRSFPMNLLPYTPIPSPGGTQ